VGGLRGLHSSPTRRSSDLRGGSWDEDRWPAGGAAGRSQLHSIDHADSKQVEAEFQGAGGQVAQGEAAVPALGGLGLQYGALLEEDRKSTRLNSSHVKISYA